MKVSMQGILLLLHRLYVCLIFNCHELNSFPTSVTAGKLSKHIRAKKTSGLI